MSEVLFVLGKYIQHIGQNGNCIRGIIDVWKQQGINSDVICIETEDVAKSWSDENVTVISYDTNSENSCWNNISRIINIPMTNVSHVKKIIKEIEKKISNKKYDAIIAVINPVEAAHAVTKIKKKYPEINFILYEIDPTSNRYKNPKGLKEKIWTIKSICWEKKVYRNANTIIHMKTHRSHYDQFRYKIFKNKTVYLDIPNLKINLLRNQINNEVVFLYAGAFYPVLREPGYMLQVFEKLSCNMQYVFNIFSQSFVKTIQESAIHSDNCIRLKKTISHELLVKEMEIADILVSVGNKDSDYLPSKVLEYIGTGKKIIHFYSDNEDVALAYFRRYSKVLLISESEDIEEAVKKIVHFIGQDNFSEINAESIKYQFWENTVEYSAEKIKELL